MDALLFMTNPANRVFWWRVPRHQCRRVRRGAIGGVRDVLYHVDWQRTPHEFRPGTLEPLPLTRLRDAAQCALDDVLAARGRERLESAIAAQDDLAAVLLCAGLREMGATIGADFTADSLRVAVPMRPVFEQLMLKLQKRGLVESSGSGYQPNPAFTTAAESANEAQRQFITEHPGHLPEAQLVAGNCAELGPILRGEKDAVQVLFAGAGAELLDQFYGDGLLTSHWLAAITAAVQEAARALPRVAGCGFSKWAPAPAASARSYSRPWSGAYTAHIHRRLRCVLLECASEARELPRSRNQDF